MESDFKVTVEYKNQNMETVVEKEYDFISYTEMIHIALMKIIAEIEDAFYSFSDGKQKEDWSPEMVERFKKIRHKLLDQANAIKRLPQNLTYKGIRANQIPASEFINMLTK
jgi:hypothetical protein